MNKLMLAATVLMVTTVPTAAWAQDSAARDTASPDTRGVSLDPYVGVQGGYEDFDSDNDGPITTRCNGRSGCPDGGVIEAVAGVNVLVGPVFVGVEGNVAAGFNGIRKEGGIYARYGFRAGDSGLIYGKAGRQWIDTEDKGKNDNWSWGLGVEIAPSDIGLGFAGKSGIRLRGEVTTYDLHSIRPMGGVVFHF